MTSRFYLDHAASSPLRACARAAMVEALAECGNASSVHAEGQRARALIEEARRNVAELLGVRPEMVVLTSGGTEANNLALRGLSGCFEGKKVAVSAIEHDCILKTARVLGMGDGEALTVTEGALWRPEEAAKVLKRANVGLASLMHANNETGVVQPIADFAEMCREHGVLSHTDAVQTVGHMPVSFYDLGVDALTLSGHKFGAPLGVGALVLRGEADFVPQLTGGAQERNRRAGTENVPALAGLAAAVRELLDTGTEEWARLAELGAMMDELLAGVAGIEVVAPDSLKVAHVRQVRVPGRRGEDLVIAMDMQGVAVSQGSACGSGRVAASHVLRAMGWDEVAAGEVVRLSLGWSSTEADVRAGVAALARVAAG